MSSQTLIQSSTVFPLTPTPIVPSGSDLVINDSIDAYKAALQGDPGNAHAWAELARIQTYSSSLLRNDTERLERLDEARASADKAIELAPDDSTVRSIRAFVLDWYAANSLVDPETRGRTADSGWTGGISRLPT